MDNQSFWVCHFSSHYGWNCFLKHAEEKKTAGYVGWWQQQQQSWLHLWFVNASRQQQTKRDLIKTMFWVSSPRARVPCYSLMSFYSALCYCINYWRFVLMAHIVVTTWCRNCINTTSPFNVCKCAVIISPLPKQKLSLYSMYFTSVFYSSICGVEFGRDSKCRKLQKLQISVLKLKRSAFWENRLLENWVMTST